MVVTTGLLPVGFVLLVPERQASVFQATPSYHLLGGNWPVFLQVCSLWEVISTEANADTFSRLLSLAPSSILD